MNLAVKYFGDTYEVVKTGTQPSASCGERCSFSEASAHQFVSHVQVSTQAWRGLLMQLSICVPANFHHHNDILNTVAQLFASGRLQCYKIPRFEKFVAVPCGKGMGITFIKGPRAYNNLMFKPLVINSVEDATNLVASLATDNKRLMNCFATNGLKNQLSETDDNKKILINKLVSKVILAYRVPVYGNAPPRKKEEYLSATGPGYDKVPLAPESKPVPKKSSPINTAPTCLNDCEKKLADARVKLDSEGYTPKYTDEAQLEKVSNNSVANERFLVSFQTRDANPNAKLAFQRESGLAPIWCTSFDQLEYADTDPELIAKVLGTTYDPSKDYVLHVVDRGEDLSAFGQNTIVPTWDNMQQPVQKYLGGKHDPEILTEVMTPEYQKQYAKDIEKYNEAGLDEFKARDQEEYIESLRSSDVKMFEARHNVRTEIGANSEFTGNGLTQSREGNSQYGVVETLTLENNPPPISKMSNVKTVLLKPRSIS